MTLRILGGRYKGRTLHSPKTNKTRPTQGILRQAVFNICQHSIDGARFLDLFAGSGAMGLEAISRGASTAFFVEQDKSAARCIRENISELRLEAQATLLQQDLFSALKSLGKKSELFDIVYIDPPYGDPSHLNEVLTEIEKQNILAPESLVFIETSSEEPELTYESARLKLRDMRRFGIARLTKLESKHNLYKKTPTSENSPF